MLYRAESTPCEDSEMSVDNTPEELASFHNYRESDTSSSQQLHVKTSGTMNSQLHVYYNTMKP